MELERAEIPMFLSSNTRRATEWRREGERAVLRFNLRGMKEDKCSQILAGRCLEFLRSDYNTVPSP